MVNRGLAMVGLTVRSIFFDRKTMIVGAILLLLLTIPLLWLRNPSGEDDAAMDFFMGIMVMLYLQFIVLYVCFLYATALVTSEIEDKTMTYLISRPITRFEIMVYKYLGYVVSIFTLFAIPAILNYLILAPHQGVGGLEDNLDMLAYSLGGIFMGVVAWGALFLLMASVFRNPLMPGFLYCIFWESFIANIGTNVSKVTVTYQIRTFIINGLKAIRESIAEEGDLPAHGDYTAGWAFVLAMGVSVLFVLLSWWMVRGKDFH